MYNIRELEKAIDRGEIFTVYQPKVDLISGDVVGLEVLARWAHEKDGILNPDVFIDLAENSGKIDELAMSIIGSALDDRDQWLSSGEQVCLALNVSMQNLISSSFGEFIEGEIDKRNITQNEIILEVKESGLIEDYAEVREVITRLRAKKISISIDDFGAAGGSFVQLKEIPFDEIKIDRKFVQGAHSNPTLQVICESGIRIASQSNARLVAEGIEDIDDWRYLKESGCKIGQGFFIGKPFRSSLFKDWRTLWKRQFRTIERELGVNKSA